MNEIVYVVCDNCGLKYEEKDVKLSKMTGEHYCYHGENSCWKQQAQIHKEQMIEWHGEATPFE